MSRLQRPQFCQSRSLKTWALQMNLEMVPSFGNLGELMCARELLVRSCVGLTDAWTYCWWHYPLHGKDDRLSCYTEWHADNVRRFVTGLSSAPRSSHECAVRNARLRVYVEKPDMIKMTLWASVTRSCCWVQRRSVSCSRSGGRMLACTEGLNLDLCRWLVRAPRWLSGPADISV